MRRKRRTHSPEFKAKVALTAIQGDLPRSTFYHVPNPVFEEELEQMALIDRCHLKYPFYGSRRIRDWLEDHGYWVNRKKVQRLWLQREVREGVSEGL